jgi:phosphoenolpyruvate synthase/pyruvate phosphate dikinase
MLGFRGASRYIAHSFRDCFELECAAMKKVRNELGLTNVQLMVPFVRNLGEAKGVVDLLAEHGLKRGENELKLIMMCEIPSNALLAEQFLEHFDGFSIGSNDLTQLTLGLDRDSGLVARAFDERDPAVKSCCRWPSGRQQARQVRRHLRPGPVGSPDLRRVADGRGHPDHLAQPGYGGRYLAEAGGAISTGRVFAT